MSDSKCELGATGIGQIKKKKTKKPKPKNLPKPELQKGQSHEMNQVVELVLFAVLALVSLVDAVAGLVPPEGEVGRGASAEGAGPWKEIASPGLTKVPLPIPVNERTPTESHLWAAFPRLWDSVLFTWQ